MGLRKRKEEESQITIIDSLVPGNPELDLSVNLIGSEVLPNCHHPLPVRAVWGSCKWIKISTPEIRAGPGVETHLRGGMVTCVTEERATDKLVPTVPSPLPQIVTGGGTPTTG